VYGQEVVMLMEYIVPNLCISTLTDLIESGAKAKKMSLLLELEEDKFIAGFQQQVQKVREKAWHDRHIKQNKFQFRDLVLLDQICDKCRNCSIRQNEWRTLGRVG